MSFFVAKTSQTTGKRGVSKNRNKHNLNEKISFKYMIHNILQGLVFCKKSIIFAEFKLRFLCHLIMGNYNLNLSQNNVVIMML